jgi:hypothetical protein
MSAVGENRFPGVQSYFFLGPEDAVADAIRNVHFASSGKANKRDRVNAKIGIVMRGDGIDGEDGLQFAAAACAAGNDGIREDGAVGGRDLWGIWKKAS